MLGNASSRCRLFVASAALLVMTASQAIAANLPPAPTGVDIDAFNRSWEETAAKLAQSPDPKLEANKKLVVGFLYGMILSTEGREQMADVAAKYLDKDYIQHDPNVPPGRDGLVRWFNAGGSVPNTPTAPKVDLKRIGFPHLVTVVAENDFVTSVSTHTWPDPTDDSKNYDVFHIAVFRIRDGRIVEHWNQALKGAYWCRLSWCDPPAKKH